MGIYFQDYLDGSKVITRVLLRGRQERHNQRRRCDDSDRGQRDVIAERGHKPRKPNTSRSWKRQGSQFFPRAPRRLYFLILAREPMLDF